MARTPNIPERGDGAGGVRVLVCGGRTYGRVPDFCPPEALRDAAERARRERFLLTETLDVMNSDTPIAAIIHGAQKGADTIAGEWARRNSIEELPFPADWKKHGRRAGPIRNAVMLEAGNPTFVVAAPGGTGTADMVRRARAAGVRVVEVE